MNKKLPLPISLLLLLCIGFPLSSVQANSYLLAGAQPNDIITAVNALRQEHGLDPLNAHPILMQLAQKQAEYMAATGQITHLSADGRRPFQRALAAGFPIAGDLSQGGYYSENIQSGPGMSAQEVITVWMGDDPHQNTMLSSMRSDMGAGIAFAGDMAYYVLDTALSSPYRVVVTLAVSPSAPAVYVIAPAATATPRPDGSIVHTVRMGETLWGIAAVYGNSVEQIAQLNQINPNHFISPGDELLLRPPATPTVIGGNGYEERVPTVVGSYDVRNITAAKPHNQPTQTATRTFGPFTNPEQNRLLGWVVLLVATALTIFVIKDWLRPG